MAVFTTMLMISGGLDLSVGSVAALTGVVIAVLQPVARHLAGALAGCWPGRWLGPLNGLLVTHVGINAVITTLGTLYVARGAGLRALRRADHTGV